VDIILNSTAQCCY